MGWITRLCLRLLGWRPDRYVGRDHRGDRYQAWTRRDGSYFHVYHERRGWKDVVRP